MSAEKLEGKKVITHKVAGTVKCYNAVLGFGFITRDDTKEDVCFHELALKDNTKKAIRSINDGQVVQFDIVVGENGGSEVGNLTGPGGVDLEGSPHVAECNLECSSSEEEEETEQFGKMSVLDAMMNNFSDKASWWNRLRPEDRYEWLVNCYQMRVDDDYAWGGNLRGLYDCSGDPDRRDIARDFFVFCRFAKENGVLPKEGFEWRPLIKRAKKLLGFAFEKSDAKERWGGENVFSAGPSLRRTAEHVYGVAMAGEDEQFREKVRAHEDDFDEGMKRSAGLLEPYGGKGLWAELLRDMVLVG